MAQKLPEEISNELWKAINRLEIANDIIKDHCSGEFGTLLISNKYKGEGKDKIQSILDNYNLPIFYWMSSKTGGNFHN